MKTALLGAAALLVGLPARAQTCADCCCYARLASAIQRNLGMRDMYQQLSTRSGLDWKSYDAQVQSTRASLAQMAAEREAGIARCNWRLPDPKDSMAMRAWSQARWGVTEDPATHGYAYNFSVNTNMDTCEINAIQLDLYRKIVPCSGFADATEVHEGKHVAQCQGRHGKKAPSPNVAGKDEVAGHDAEIAKLRSLLDEAQKACQRRSCEERSANEAADRLKEALPVLRGGK